MVMFNDPLNEDLKYEISDSVGTEMKDLQTKLKKARKKARYNKRRYQKMRYDLHSAVMNIMEVRNRYMDSNIQFGIDSALNILRGYFEDV